jgi:putative PIN family toxin of toxin-antitoxin system
MIKAVLDTTVLVSAFLKPTPGGVSFELLLLAKERRFELHISDEILDEVAGALSGYERMKRRYQYSDSAIVEYRQNLQKLAKLVRDVPEVRGVVVRDPDDDKIVACAVAARAKYIVTRDKDSLSIGRHQDIAMVTPEAFLQLLRAEE